jgi:Transposase IS4
LHFFLGTTSDDGAADDIVGDDEHNVPQTSTSKRRKVERKKRLWIKSSVDGIEQMKWSDDARANKNQDVDHLNLTPVHFFEQFFDSDILDFIVLNTEKYAREIKGKHQFSTSASELKACIATLLLSGYSVFPRREMYWERSEDCGIKAVYNAMSRNRFDELLRYIHLADNNNLNTLDKLCKVRQYLNLINERCLKNFSSVQNLSIDETMVPYFGRHSAKQFIRNKPVRFGHKVWSLATPSGYVAQFDPYVGASATIDRHELGLGPGVVLNLITCLPPKPYRLYFDNYFTTLALMDRLSEKGIGAIGTIRANRLEQCPLMPVTEMKKKVRGVYDYRSDRHSHLTILQWNDNSVVSIASNFACDLPLKTVQRWSKKEKKFIQVTQPNIISLYNQNMGGVDRADQNVAKYRISMRTKKWWWPFFAWPIDLCLQNAWLLYRQSESYTSQPLDLLAFRRHVVNSWLLQWDNKKSRSTCTLRSLICKRVPIEMRLSEARHMRIDLSTTRRCAICKKTCNKGCSVCPVGLHFKCFNLFHGHNV